MNDESFDELVEQMSRHHNPPPETPRDRMWERIDAERRSRGRVDRSEARASTGLNSGFWRLAAAAVAILAIGIAVGKMLPQDNGQPAPMAEVQPSITPGQEAPGSLLYEHTATRLFGQADALLTDFRATSCSGKNLEATHSWAGDMLLQTRLLLGTDLATDDPADRQLVNLLLDLEMVLAQIAGISNNNCARDMAWIREGIEERSTIDRLRLMSAGETIHKSL